MRLTYLLSLCLLTACKNIVSTDDLLSTTGISAPLIVNEPFLSVPVGTQKEITVRGGTQPYTVKITGRGAAQIAGSKLTYTAAELLSRDILVITDSAGRSATISIETFDNGKEPNQLTGNILWLKADSLNLADGAAVTSWPDASGNARDYTIGTNKPTLVANSLNGLAAVSFNGSNQYLERAYDSNLNPTAITIFVLHSVGTYPSGYAALFTSRGAGFGYILYLRHNTVPKAMELYYGNGGGYEFKTGTSSIDLNTWYLSEVAFQQTNSSYILNQNGVTIVEYPYIGVPMALNSTSPSRVGAGNTETLPSLFYNGKIAELIIFNRVLTKSEFQNIRCYLKKKYALAFGCEAA